MQLTLASGAVAATTACSVCSVSMPHTSAASWKLTLPSSMNTKTGFLEAPSTTTMSKPANLMACANSPAALELAMPPVSGDLVTSM